MTIVLLIFFQSVSGQFFNKEVEAILQVTSADGLFTLYAVAENKTSLDQGFTYDFSIFRKNEEGEFYKTQKKTDAFIKGNSRLLLSKFTVAEYGYDDVVITLLIYDVQEKPVGKARLVLKRLKNGEYEAQVNGENEETIRSRDLGEKDKGLGLTGFVLRKTITKVGLDFYRLFYATYYNSQIKTDKDIKIIEVPGQNRITRITVSVEGQTVWEFFAQPKKSFLKQMSDIAFQRSIRMIQILEQQDEQLIKF
ncbi:CsgE family curli-type amyloid fiber assembly protein [Dokdonia sinensis]|uniref:CsgE family curli-type amyloid fiber assembly protein n=1 Tax=Dokdonia sinensis TaxID=2479847 RepID=UPI001374EC4A|nr:CsgE family curli-type amyloid fiber assembly protein [Dokdonia sinensis]